MGELRLPLGDYRETVHLCRLCGNCRQAGTTYLPCCPAGERFGFDEYYSRGKAIIAGQLLKGSLAWSRSLAEVVYRCAVCGACVEQCPVSYKDYILDVFAALREECVERSLVPREVGDFLENVYKYGNPWAEPRQKRGLWAEGTGIGEYERGEDFLYYVGCMGSFDTRGIEMARALGEVLLASGLSFGILGSGETCEGNEVKLLGERGLFEILAGENIRRFTGLGVKRVVTLSPHAYNAMKNEYPAYGGNFEVKHYTQLLVEMVVDGRIDLSKGVEARVTYHDSCFLGRYNQEYEAPRKILRSIPGVELVEMERNRENSFCCGGGGGNFYTDFFGSEPNSPARIRVREALDTGADILAVACPVCLTMLDDAAKAEGTEGGMRVMDISEILASLVLPERGSS
ncbi:MAG: (Fe-S)-binding protein [Deltaproteobacteria bacterium]|nr:(Fe-S)-binding protein [Deltaproteobacteria bacterium]